MTTVKVRLKEGTSFFDPSNELRQKVNSNKEFVEVQKTTAVLTALAKEGLEEYDEKTHGKEVKETAKASSSTTKK